MLASDTYGRSDPEVELHGVLCLGMLGSIQMLHSWVTASREWLS